MACMETQKGAGQTPGYRSYSDKHYENPGLGSWVRRNSGLLVRLFIVMVFTFGASTTASNYIYGLHKKPVELTPQQVKAGKLPPGVQSGDYVEIRGTPDYGKNFKQYGTSRSKIGVASRYEVAYFYFKLKETGNNLLVQTSKGSPGTISQGAPDTTKDGTRVWRGKLETVGSVIFPHTTQEALKQADLPRNNSTLVIATGETPGYYRRFYSAFDVILAIWALSIAWLLWKRNKPLIK